MKKNLKDSLLAKNELTPRDVEVLELVGRYRLATLLTLHRVLFQDIRLFAVGKVTRRLTAKGWLQRHALEPRSCYFTLTPKTSCLLGLPSGNDRALSAPEELLGDYGLLEYCCLAEHGRKRLTKEEVQERCPGLLCAGLDADRYFLDEGFRPAKCGLAWVDRGDDTAQLVSACRADWDARLRQEAFRGAVKQSGLRLVVLTPTEERAAVLRRHLAQGLWTKSLAPVVEVVPGMLPLFLKLEPFASGAGAPMQRVCRAGAGAKAGFRTGARHQVRHPQLTLRDYEILQYLLRNRIATIASLKRDFFSELTRCSVSMVCSRLLHNGWLHRHGLGAQGCYFTLSFRAARLMGNPPSAVTGPLAPEELARDCCLLEHCGGGSQGRRRLTREDLEEQHPHLLCPGLDADRYFLDTRSQAALLGMVCLDADPSPAGTAVAFKEEWEQRWRHLPFRRHVAQNGFDLAFFSALPKRADALRRELEKQRWPQGVRLDVATLPQLLPLVGSLGQKEASEGGIEVTA